MVTSEESAGSIRVAPASEPPSASAALPASIETLRRLAEAHGFTLQPKEETTYLELVDAALEDVRVVQQLPDYIDPRISTYAPAISKDPPREYARPDPKDNPLKAWSHKTQIKPSSPSSEGLLHGKTVTVKDNTSVAGVPLTSGTSPFTLSKNAPYPIPTLDAVVVSRVLEAGGTLVGTATCENYCQSARSCTSATGPVHNPWQRGYDAGGSSSGCAALVGIKAVRKWRAARGLLGQSSDDNDLGDSVDFAVGGDQGGSIRLPAAYCGIYGLKPTHGLVPYTGMASLHPLVDHAGPMATSIRDTAMLLTVLSGYDGFDPRMTPESPLRSQVSQYHEQLDSAIQSRAAAGNWSKTSAARGMRIGVLKESFEIAGLDSGVADVIRRAADRFVALGAAVDEASVPMHAVAPAVFTAATRVHMADVLLSANGVRSAAVAAASSSKLLDFPYPANPSASAGRVPDQPWYDEMTRSNPLVPGAVLSGAYLRDVQERAAADYYNYTGGGGGGGGGGLIEDKAKRHIHQLRAAYDEALEQFDVLITPATPTVAGRQFMDADTDDVSGDDVSRKAGYLLSNNLNTLPFNLTGHPGFVIPVGWAAPPEEANADGNDIVKLPVGMQIVGKRWDEQTVFLAAAAWEVGGWGLDEE